MVFTPNWRITRTMTPEAAQDISSILILWPLFLDLEPNIDPPNELTISIVFVQYKKKGFNTFRSWISSDILVFSLKKGRM
jgi:hypothetical protein